MVKDLDRSKPLWEIHVEENYDENTSIVFILVHHILSDGMGIMSLITFMNDEHNPNIVTQYRNIPFLYYYVLPILYIPIGFVRFTIDAIRLKADRNMYPFQLKEEVQTKNKEYFETKLYAFSDLKKCYTQFGRMKLNDFLMASVSAAFSKYF